MAEDDRRTCLFICDRDDGNSPPNPIAEVLLETLVRPALAKFPEFDPMIFESGPVYDLLSRIREPRDVDLVISDLTNALPNSWLELGSQAAFGVPTVLIVDAEHVVGMPGSVNPYSMDEPGPNEREIDRLTVSIGSALSEPRRGPAGPRLPPHVQRVEFANRISETAEALKLLRSNSAASAIAELESIAEELRQIPDDQSVDLRKLLQAALKVLQQVLEELGTTAGARILICGAVASLVGGVGSPGVTAFATALSVWYGKDAFKKAIDKVDKYRRGAEKSSGAKTDKKQQSSPRSPRRR